MLVNAESIGFFDHTFYYYRKDNITAMTKKVTSKNVLSNLSVSKKWFYYFKNSNFSEAVKKAALTRFANSYIYMIKIMKSLSSSDYGQVKAFIKENSEMLKYVSGFPCKSIYVLAKLIGFRNTSRLLNIREVIK